MVKVSIITPTYNGEKFLATTLQSVIDQDFQDYEHIIIDDGSTDQTLEILQTYSTTSPQITILKNQTHLGIVGSRNKGLQLAQGEYLCFLDHDDVRSKTDKLSKQISFLDRHPAFGMVGSHCEYIDETGDIFGNMKYATSDTAIRKALLKWNQFCTCAVMLRASLLEKTGLLDKKYDKVDDYDLRLKIGCFSKLANLDEYLVQYRKSGTNTSKQHRNFFKMKWLHLQLILKNRHNYPKGLIALLFGLANLALPYQLAEKIRPLRMRRFH